jgi:hypothetical protein
VAALKGKLLPQKVNRQEWYEANNLPNMGYMEYDFMVYGNRCEIDVITPEIEIIQITAVAVFGFVKNGMIFQPLILGL